MKAGNTIKLFFAVLFAVIFFIACEEDKNSGGNNYYIDSVFANGSADSGTTMLIITVNDDKLVITADDIKINAAFPVIKGSLNRTDAAKTYALPITSGDTGVIRVGFDPYRGFTGWDAKTAVVYADWYFTGTTELTITGCGLPVIPLDKIPSEIAGLPVTAIGSMAFYDKELIKIEIPESVKVIEDNAFSNNLLKEIIIPVNVTTLGPGAFAYNQLSGVTIPEGVTVINNSVFAYNQLEYINFLGDAVSIGEDAFAFNKLEEVHIPKSVVSIGNGAFSNNKLDAIEIPDSVINIDAYAFIENPLTEITIGRNVTLGRNSFGNDFERAYNDNEKKKGKYTFSGNTWIYNP